MATFVSTYDFKKKYNWNQKRQSCTMNTVVMLQKGRNKHTDMSGFQSVTGNELLENESHSEFSILYP